MALAATASRARFLVTPRRCEILGGPMFTRAGICAMRGLLPPEQRPRGPQ